MARQTVDGAPPKAAGTARQVERLRRRVEELEELVESFYDVIVELEVTVIDGYFVKIWSDPESGGYVADCPTVRATSQGDAREEAVANITSAIEQMVGHLADPGAPIPPKDV